MATRYSDSSGLGTTHGIFGPRRSLDHSFFPLCFAAENLVATEESRGSPPARRRPNLCLMLPSATAPTLGAGGATLLGIATDLKLELARNDGSASFLDRRRESRHIFSAGS